MVLLLFDVYNLKLRDRRFHRLINQSWKDLVPIVLKYLFHQRPRVTWYSLMHRIKLTYSQHHLPSS